MWNLKIFFSSMIGNPCSPLVWFVCCYPYIWNCFQKYFEPWPAWLLAPVRAQPRLQVWLRHVQEATLPPSLPSSLKPILKILWNGSNSKQFFSFTKLSNSNLVKVIICSLSMSNVQNMSVLWHVPRKTSRIKTTNSINKENSILQS